MSGLQELIASHKADIVAATLAKEEAPWPQNAMPHREWALAMLADLTRALVSERETDDMSIGEIELARQQGAARRDARDRPYVLIHDFAMLCDSVSEVADAQDASIDPEDNRIMNLWLDGCIATGIEMFESVFAARRENDRTHAVGFALASHVVNTVKIARLAYEAIKSGRVGTASHTSSVLERSLTRLETSATEALARLGKGSA